MLDILRYGVGGLGRKGRGRERYEPIQTESRSPPTERGTPYSLPVDPQTTQQACMMYNSTRVE